jgi:hypothetical protein
LKANGKKSAKDSGAEHGEMLMGGDDDVKETQRSKSKSKTPASEKSLAVPAQGVKRSGSKTPGTDGENGEPKKKKVKTSSEA